MNKVIIYGGNHYNTLGLIRSVGSKGFDVIVLLHGCTSPCLVSTSRYISKLYFVKDDSDVLKSLEIYYNEPEKPFILCSSDLAQCVIDANFNRLSRHFILFNINNKQGSINYFMHKGKTFPIAEESGIKLIRTWSIIGSQELPSDIVFPCITKPESSLAGEKTDMVICYNKEELCTILKSGKKLLVQEYVEKDFELNIIGVSFNHGKKVILPAAIRKIRDHIQWQSMYMRLDNFNNYPQLDLEKLKAFVARLGYEGLFSIELLCKNDQFYFLEINMRNDGCCYIYTASGVNLPYLWLKYTISGTDSLDENKIICRTPFNLMNEYDIYNIYYKRVKPLRWLVECCRSDAYFIYNHNDLRPFLFFLKSFCNALFSKILAGHKRGLPN